MRKRRRVFFRQLASAVVVVGMMATSCADSSDERSTALNSGTSTAIVADGQEPVLPPRRGGTLTYGLMAETDGWNPMRNRWAASGLSVSYAIFDRLAAYDETGQVRGYLAESFVPNADFTQWTIKLRPGVRFHDGTPVDADAVKMNLEASRDATTSSGSLRALSRGNDAVAVVDSTTVKVQMNTPWSTFPHVLTRQVGTMAAPAMLQSPDGGSMHPVGSGPFVFDSWVPGAKLIVKRNPNYWQEGFPYLDSIEFVPQTDNQGRAGALRAATLDAMENLDSPTLASFDQEIRSGEFRYLQNPRSEDEEVMVLLNLSQPPFDDPLAREALAQATNQQAYIDLTGGLREPAEGMFDKNSRWHTETDWPAYDLESARRKVQQYKDAHGGQFTFELNGPPTAEVEAGQQVLQEQWRDAGIDVTISNFEQTSLISKVVVGDFQGTIFRLFSAPHPDGEFQTLTSANAKPKGEVALNFARNADPEIDRALEAARRTDDPAAQKQQYDIVQRRLAAAMPYIWLYHVNAGVIASRGVHDMTRWSFPGTGPKGFGMNGLVHPWHQVWMD